MCAIAALRTVSRAARSSGFRGTVALMALSGSAPSCAVAGTAAPLLLLLLLLLLSPLPEPLLPLLLMLLGLGRGGHIKWPKSGLSPGMGEQMGDAGAAPRCCSSCAALGRTERCT